VIPSLAAFLGMLVVMRRLGRELFADGDVAAFSAFVFSSSYLVWGLAQTARMDLGFTLFVSIGALWLYEFLESEDPRELYAAAAATAVGILIKGPMAFVVLLVLLILQRIRRKRLPAANYLLTFGIVLVIPLLWLVPAILRGGKDFGREIVITQNIGRAVGSWVHRAPPWFYVLRAPLTFFPWFLLVIVAIVAIARAGRREAASSPVDRRRASELFCIDWMLAVLIPFSVISGKLDIYMLPAFPPLALLITDGLNACPDAPREHGRGRSAWHGLAAPAPFAQAMVLHDGDRDRSSHASHAGAPVVASHRQCHALDQATGHVPSAAAGTGK